MRVLPQRLSAAAFVATVLATAVTAQSSAFRAARTLPYTFYGPKSYSEYGSAVAGAGDVNGDGLADVIVGCQFEDGPTPLSGAAHVYSGASGSILHSVFGDSYEDFFGVSVSGAGDVDADGFDDFIVGANGDDPNGDFSGSARVFSGRDGSVLHILEGEATGHGFGLSVSGAGDIDADGHDDVFVGVPGYVCNGIVTGAAQVFSGQDGSLLFTFCGEQLYEGFGASVSGAGDVNGDGTPDLVVGAQGNDDNGEDAGRVRVFSGLDGSVLHDFAGDSEYDWFGHVVSGAGDVNADGYDDVIVAAPFDDDGLTYSGSARVFSGFDGSVLYAFFGDSEYDNMGSSVAGAGDVDGDGFDDVIVGVIADDTNGLESGTAYVFSGADGSVLLAAYGDADDWFGAGVSGAGDVNGDGQPDLVVGALFDDSDIVDCGSVRVFSR